MATIPRTFLTTSKAELPNKPLINGQFWILWDADEAWYDAPDDGTPNGIPVRRQISGVKIVSTLPTGSDISEGLLYVYMPESQEDWDLRVWLNDAWKIVGNVTPDTKVQTDTSNGKFYITGTSEIADGAIGSLLKNADVYIQGGEIYGDLHGNATSATTAATATRAVNADTAGVAIKDDAPVANNITSYLHGVSSNATTNLGSTLTFTDGLGNEVDVRVSDTTYSAFTQATAGLVPAPTGGTASDLVLTGAGWVDKDILPVGSAETAESATKDSADQTITTTYYAEAEIVDGDLVLTKGDGVTATTLTIPGATAVFSPSDNGLVPAPSGTGETAKFLRGDGSWQSVPVAVYQGATASAAGVDGLVPHAAIGEMNSFLRGDATWGSVVGLNNAGLAPAATLSDADKFLQIVSDGQGGLVGQWSSSGLDTKNTAGATQIVLDDLDTDDLFTGDGETVKFYLKHTVVEFYTVTIDGVETSAYTYSSEENAVVFNAPPALDSEIDVSYQTYDYTEVMYLVGSKDQTANPQTYTDALVYVQDDYLYSKGNQVVDVNSTQDLINKTFDGNALNSAAFRRADDSVTITNVTITDSFIADGENTDFTVDNPISTLTSVEVSELITSSETFTGDGTTGEFTLTDTPLTISSVTIEGEPATGYTFDREYNSIIFDEAPADQTTIVVAYTMYSPITTPTYTLDTTTNTITFDTAPTEFDKIVITYVTPDPEYDSSDVPTNQAVISYTNSRVGSLQTDLARRASIDVIASDYDDTATYELGDYCMYYSGTSTDLYKCKVPITVAEDWDATHWDKVKVADSIEEIEKILIEEFDFNCTMTRVDNPTAVALTVSDGSTPVFSKSYTTDTTAGDFSAVTSGFTYSDKYFTVTVQGFSAVTDETMATVTINDSTYDIICSETDSSKASTDTFALKVDAFITLNSLSDTDIVAPTDGQVLRYNSTKVKWENVNPIQYSATEQLVGTWLDGSNLYEQTLTLSNLTASAATTVAHSISADKIFILDGFTEYSISSDNFVGIISAYNATAGDEQLCIKIDGTNITYMAGTNLSGATAYITVRYTKPAI